MRSTTRAALTVAVLFVAQAHHVFLVHCIGVVGASALTAAICNAVVTQVDLSISISVRTYYIREGVGQSSQYGNIAVWAPSSRPILPSGTKSG